MGISTLANFQKLNRKNLKNLRRKNQKKTLNSDAMSAKQVSPVKPNFSSIVRLKDIIEPSELYLCI